MPRTRRFTVGILLALSLVTASATAAASALAAPAHPLSASKMFASTGFANTVSASEGAARMAPAGTGSFHTWKAAQTAAGFSLRRPTETAGLNRAGGIMVDNCPASGGHSKRDVIATYGSFQHRLLGIHQNNYGHPCVSLTGIRKLHTYKVEGTTAQLWGLCHVAGVPTCKTRKMSMFLSWHKDGIYYLATSHNVRRATIVAFARKLTKVG